VVRNRVLLLACAALLPIADCHRAERQYPGLVVQSDIEPRPVHTGSATIMLTLSDSSTKPATGAGIVIEADMSHAGMAPVFSESKEVEPGRYRGNLMFSMPGDWVILLHITLAGGVKVERQIDVPRVAAH
jgi:YtkA-like